jgi:RNA polymerase sigma-70 factor, ECF subfamily
MSLNQRANQKTHTGATVMSAARFSELHADCRSRLLNSMTGIVRNRDTAEDITAMAFSKAFQKRSQFRGESSFYTWVHAIALNEARRCPSRFCTVSLELLGPEEKELRQPDLLCEGLSQSDCCARLRKALRGIPALSRRALVDHFVRGYPVRRIARQDPVPVGTVLSRIFTAKRHLRKAWSAITVSAQDAAT